MEDKCLAFIVFIGFLSCSFVDGGKVSKKCIKCICVAMSDCDTSLGCSGDVCGPYRMTKFFWIDGGRPHLKKDSSVRKGAYQRCANDMKCSTRAVFKYLKRYSQDCDDDGEIDCHDYAMIVKYGGGGGCKANQDEDFVNTIDDCLNEDESK